LVTVRIKNRGHELCVGERGIERGMTGMGYNVVNPKRSNILPARNIPRGNMLEWRDPTWSAGMSELSVDEIV